jgi:hypothetical protein
MENIIHTLLLSIIVHFKKIHSKLINFITKSTYELNLIYFTLIHFILLRNISHLTLFNILSQTEFILKTACWSMRNQYNSCFEASKFICCSFYIFFSLISSKIYQPWIINPLEFGFLQSFEKYLNILQPCYYKLLNLIIYWYSMKMHIL